MKQFFKKITMSIVIATSLYSYAYSAALGLHAGRDESITQYDDFGKWLGKPVIYRVTFLDDASWQTISSPYFLSATKAWLSSDPNRVEVVSVPLVAKVAPKNGLAEVAAGNHDDSFSTLAKNLNFAGSERRIIVRLGWELNGTWFAWSAVNNPALYVRAFRRVVTLMRTEAPHLRFEWNLARTGASNFRWADAYPGDDVVDIISMDVYDQYNRGWSDLLHGTQGLIRFRAFARAHGKPEAYSEWSLSTSNRGNGDSPEFIEHMRSWLHAADTNVLYQAYWNTYAGGPNAAIAGPAAGNVPRAATTFRTLFSKP